MTTTEIAQMIDHAVLHPTQTDADLEQACAIADQWAIKAICVKPYHVLRTAALLSASEVRVCTVIGFPHGGHTTEVKMAETLRALNDGASEIDMVINIGKTRSADWGYVDAEIEALNTLCISRHALLKVIFETDFLPDEESKVRLCEICNRHRVAFVKTSTGFGFVRTPDGHYAYQGATEADVRLMRAVCTPGIQIKASGGIRTLDQLLKFHALGATRIGTSSTVEILEEARQRFG